MSGDGTKSFADQWWAFEAAKDKFETALSDAGVEYDHIGGDWYDNSLEIYGVAPDWRPSDAVQKLCLEAGFSKVYANHDDGWETHFPGVQGHHTYWRRRYVSDPSATTTNVLAGPPNPGYFEISYWPDGWDKQRGWLDTGYMRIVPDPLESARPQAKGANETS